MIIKRMAEGIRTQNWFTVIVEILIVVIGIFIGLQVDDWNQTRKADIESQIFLSQLDEDIEIVVSHIERAVLNHQFFIDNGKLAMRYLDGEDIFAEYQSEIEIAFERMHQLPMPQLRSGHLNFILSGETSQTVTNKAMQRKLVTLASQMGAAMGVYSHIRDTITELTALNRRMVGFSVPQDDDISIRYDIDALRQSEDFKIAIQNSVVFHAHALLRLRQISQILRQFQAAPSEVENAQ